MRAIIEARREKVGCLWRTKIKRKVLGYSAAVQLELLQLEEKIIIKRLVGGSKEGEEIS